MQVLACRFGSIDKRKGVEEVLAGPCGCPGTVISLSTTALGTIASFRSLGEDCDTTWVVVAEGFLVEEQMISSKLEW